MKKVLIIYPHWPPSNLAGVHRPRLIGNYLKQLGWETTVLTVNEAFYEEKLDYDFCKTVSPDIQVVKVNANKIGKVRLVGDIGLRAYKNLQKKALELLKTDKYSFIWIPIPSFYAALLGRKLFDKTGVPYGIDYIDPWVRDIHNRKDWRSIVSLRLAEWLEPIAVKKASLISGVSFEYYKPVLEKNFPGYLKAKETNKDYTNPHTNLPFIDVSMPYGFDPKDHDIKLNSINYPWNKDEIPFVYAGAYLPNSRMFMEEFMKTLNELKQKGKLNKTYKFCFLGTGSYPGETIKDLSKKYDVLEYVTETRERFKFLEILNFLSESEGVMIFGSTEKHYTASKTFQSLMSGKKIFSIFHKDSSAIQCLKECTAQEYSVQYIQDNDWKEQMRNKLVTYLEAENNNWNPNLQILKENYSSLKSAEALVNGMEQVTKP